MCYAMSYNCNVFCINGDLNQSLISSGIFQTTMGGRPCTLTCDSGTLVTDSFNSINSYTAMTTDIIIPAFISFLLITIGIYLIYKTYDRSEKK